MKEETHDEDIVYITPEQMGTLGGPETDRAFLERQKLKPTWKESMKNLPDSIHLCVCQYEEDHDIEEDVKDFDTMDTEELYWAKGSCKYDPTFVNADLLKDPHWVMVNVMRGNIKLPSWDSAHKLYPEINELKRVYELEQEIWGAWS